jgi:16S rRNA (guanine1207-N2)-methyltransferase
MIINPAQKLLSEFLKPEKRDRILLLEGGDGRLAAWIADQVPDGMVLNLSRDVRHIWAAKSRLESLPNAETGFQVIPKQEGWDTILLIIPKERRFSRSLLMASRDLLKPGGRLLLAGPTRKGAKAVIKDAAKLFGNATVLGYRSHQRVALCRKISAALPALPIEFQQTGISSDSIHVILTETSYGPLELETHPGIFSWESIDEGTQFLLNHLEIKPGDRVWDVGCGYGVIGLSSALAGANAIVMTDTNLLAVDYAKKNAGRNQLSENVRVFPADGLEKPPIFPPDIHLPDLSGYNIIVSNPAFHQGHQVDKSMADKLIAQASQILAPDGRLVMVANRFLNYDRQLQNYFSRVYRKAANNKFHVLEAMNKILS